MVDEIDSVGFVSTGEYTRKLARNAKTGKWKPWKGVTLSIFSKIEGVPGRIRRPRKSIVFLVFYKTLKRLLPKTIF